MLHVLCTLQILAQRFMKSRVRFGFLEIFQESLDVIAQQQRRFSASAAVESVNDGLVRLNKLEKIFGNFTDGRPDSEIEAQRVPHAKQNFIL